MWSHINFSMLLSIFEFFSLVFILFFHYLFNPDFFLIVLVKCFSYFRSLVIVSALRFTNVNMDKLEHSCDQCEYSTTLKHNLERHKKSIHEKLRYPCDQCENSFSQIKDLKVHKSFVHEGITHMCDMCNYVTSRPVNLKKHKKSVHDGLKYPCVKCDYVATQSTDLKKHIRNKHLGKFIYFLAKYSPFFRHILDLTKH